MIALLLLWPWTAHAVPLVTVPDDVPTLRAALTLVDSGGTVVVRASYATEPSGVRIERPVEIVGSGNPRLPGLYGTAAWSVSGATLAGSVSNPENPGWDVALLQLGGAVALEDVVFAPPPGVGGLYAGGAEVTATALSAAGLRGLPALALWSSTADIDGLSATGCLAGAVVSVDSALDLASFTVADNSFASSSIGDPGGADVYAANGRVTLRDGTSTGALSTAAGGSIAVTQAELSLESVELSDCRAAAGGCLAVADSDPTAELGPVSLVDVTLRGGVAGAYGGCAYLARDAVMVDATFDGCTVFGDSGDDLGGAVFASRSELFLDGVELLHNTAAAGGGLALAGGLLHVVGGRWEGNRAAYGGALYAEGDADRPPAVDLTGLALEDNRAVTSGGAIVQVGGALTATELTSVGGSGTETAGVLYTLDATVLLDRVDARGARADFGGFALVQGGSLTVLDSLFQDGDASGAGVLGVLEADALTVLGSRFCDNHATNGGAVLAGSFATTDARLAGNVFAGSISELGAALQLSAPADADAFLPHPVELHNNSFIDDNRALASVGVAALPVDVRNNLVLRADIGVYAVSHATVSGDHNLWWGNGVSVLVEGGVLPLPADHAVFGDPLLEAWDATACATANPSLGPGSPALHAGDPTIFNADGSRSHIGAYGGPDAPSGDRDDDGWSDALDCDDDDPAVNPAADDIWYDGFDANCDGNDDDRDRDGHPWPEDCDDLAPPCGPARPRSTATASTRTAARGAGSAARATTLARPARSPGW